MKLSEEEFIELPLSNKLKYIYEHEGLSKEEADEISFFPTLEDEAAALETQLAECQEKYEHLHQGKTLMEDAWCSPQEYEELSRKYHELIYEVATKIPGETRHETARRYIREAEERN